MTQYEQRIAAGRREAQLEEIREVLRIHDAANPDLPPYEFMQTGPNFAERERKRKRSVRRVNIVFAVMTVSTLTLFVYLFWRL